MSIPIANFTANISGFVVSFTDTSTNTPTSWAWDFGDPSSGGSNTSTLQNPSHTFSGNGLFTVSLTATNISGNTSKNHSTKISIGVKFSSPITQKLSFETDSNRIASSPSIIKDDNGRLIVFYHKQWATGKLTGGNVTNPSGFSLSIASGTGLLNENSKAWTSDSVTAIPSLFQLVYVDPLSGGNGVSITSNITMTLTKAVIPLAFIFSGSSSILRVLTIENNGNYIVAKRQQPNGMGGWIWDDYENFLNSGESPHAYLLSGSIYISYTRDTIKYLRTIQVGNESNSWTLIPDYSEQTGPIKVVNDITNEVNLLPSSLTSTIVNIFLGGVFTLNQKLYGFSNTFNNPGNTNTFYVYLPEINYNYTSPVWYLQVTYYEIYAADNITLLMSIPASNLNSWYNINSLLGNTFLYLGFRGILSVYGNYSNTFNYTWNAIERFQMMSLSDDNLVTSGNNLYSYLFDEVRLGMQASGINSIVNITETFSQLFDFETDITSLEPSGLPTLQEITETFSQLFDFIVDNTIINNGSLTTSALPIVSVLT